ncbi:hypothetical protein [Empedobacter falsenii]|uniref:hypothetical protein n=1 Tax=Empedobacter falsenii TaxID=343874 RepID=UPI003A802D6C
MSIKIQKVKIKNGMFLEYKYEQNLQTVRSNNSSNSDQPIHEDLKNAFIAITPHFAFLCEQINEKQAANIIELGAEDDDFFSNHSVESITLSGQGDTEGIVITGSKTLSNLKKISLNTPFTQWDTDYRYLDELLECVDKIRLEVQLYMDGKQAERIEEELENYTDPDDLFEENFNNDEGAESLAED